MLVAWQVEEALRRLSAEHRSALIEIYFRSRSYEEVALEFGIPTGTVKSRVYYALKALRLALEELGWNGDE
jgi:RNA polymerase sigma-70 factor (ECF subfamily)